MENIEFDRRKKFGYFFDYGSLSLLGYLSYLSQYINSLVQPHFIWRLQSIVERAGDKKFLKIIKDKIKEFEEIAKKIENKIFSFPSPTITSRIPYTPNKNERELITRALNIFKKNGYLYSPLPEIYISLETPPIFIFYPELEEEVFEERKEIYEEKRPWKEREKPETISIEDLLGCYIPEKQMILLYQRGIEWEAKKYQISEERIREIVLLHEIGHWITHLLPKQGVPPWPLEFYKLTSPEVHEGWAQLITYWVVKDVKGELEKVFEEMDKHQPSEYHVYKDFANYNQDKVISSLEVLRRISRSVEIKDWENILKFELF
ncbi:MAG: hypothetical protein ABDH37_08445 [Candidatus Hydrothermales bacterium]